MGQRRARQGTSFVRERILQKPRFLLTTFLRWGRYSSPCSVKEALSGCRQRTWNGVGARSPAKIRGVSGGGRLRSFSFRYALKRRRSARGSRKPVNLLFPQSREGGSAPHLLQPEAHMSRPPFRHGRRADGRVRPGHDVKAGATPSHLRSGRNMADGGDKGRGGD